MHHDGQSLAADEPDHDHHRQPGVASVHTRAVVTWLAIYPLATVGMSVLTAVVPQWPTAARLLVLTGFVVPTSVYVTVPWLLRVTMALDSRLRSR